MNVFRPIRAVVMALLVAGCAGHAGVEEFRVYTESVNAVAVGSEPIVGQIRIAEREFYKERISNGKEVLGKRDENAETNGYVEIFYPEHAVFFAETSDPPYTAAIVYSLATIVSYNRSLLLYADGAALEPLLAEVGRIEFLAGNATAAIGFAASAMPHMAAAQTALSALREAAHLAIQAGSREAFRTELLSREEDVQALLDALIASSETTFEYLTRNTVKALRRDNTNKAELKKLELKREMLAEWVVGLERSKVMLKKAVTAASTDGDPVAVFAGAADTFAEIRESVARIRKLSAEASF
jgi:outer membrane murein-binding lipoprotein Lpp